MNMTAQSQSNIAFETNYPNGLRCFTFWVTETLYAVDIASVLTISQNVDKIQNIPATGKGLLGMTEFQDHAIPVIDFAKMLNLESASQTGDKLIQLFNEKEQEHHEWLNALENSIVNGSPFLKAKDPGQCAFGIWRNSYTSHDETLMDIINNFDRPHKRIHQLADQLLDMRISGETEKALKILGIERDISMKRLSKYFNHAREHIQDSSRAVLLYITEDGISPTIALQIDDIYDVIDFKAEQFKPMSTIKSILGTDEAKIISAYIKLNDSADCLLIETANITEIVKSLN